MGPADSPSSAPCQYWWLLLPTTRDIYRPPGLGPYCSMPTGSPLVGCGSFTTQYNLGWREANGSSTGIATQVDFCQISLHPNIIQGYKIQFLRLIAAYRIIDRKRNIEITEEIKIVQESRRKNEFK